MAADRDNLRISTGYTMLTRPLVLDASDTINASDTIIFTVTNLQKYSQTQVVTVGLTDVSGTPDVEVSFYGRVTATSDWTEIGTAIDWTTTANDGSITATTPINYNYLKVEFIATGTTQQTKITTFEVKTANAYDIPANSGTLTIARKTAGAVTITSKDNDANAATTYRAGGTGALTIGAGTGTTAITSSDWAIDATGAMTGIGAITADGLVTADKFKFEHVTSTDVTALPAYFTETLSGTFGAAGPGYGMTVYSKIVGANLTASDSYEAAITGVYAITGTNASTYPKASVLGWILDNTTTADGAFVALIDGDTQVTQAGAAYAVRHLNSTPTSGFGYGLDLYGAAIGAYDAVSYRTADIRLVNQETITNETDGYISMGTANVTAATYNFVTAAQLTETVTDSLVIVNASIPALVAGLELTFVAEATVAGATTLTLNGVVKAVFEASDISELDSADIRDTQVVRVVYDGTQWQQISQSGN